LVLCAAGADFEVSSEGAAIGRTTMTTSKLNDDHWIGCEVAAANCRIHAGR
jgi:hypothetical protein